MFRVGNLAHIGKKKNALKILNRKPEEMRQFKRSRNTLRTVLKCKETGCQDVDWFCVVQDTVQWQAVVNTVICLQIP
jgi:hypothetical protein